MVDVIGGIRVESGMMGMGRRGIEVIIIKGEVWEGRWESGSEVRGRR